MFGKRIFRLVCLTPMAMMLVSQAGCESSGNNPTGQEAPTENRGNEEGDVDVVPEAGFCGNRTVEDEEQCDFYGIKPCSELGYTGGNYQCVDCLMDLSDCKVQGTDPPTTDPDNIDERETYCGDQIVDHGEQCDFFGFKDCNEFGYIDGSLTCVDCLLDLSSCVVGGEESEGESSDTDTGNTEEKEPQCGDQIVDHGEQCDFFGVKDCSEFGYQEGCFTCVECQFDFSGCTLEESEPEEEDTEQDEPVEEGPTEEDTEEEPVEEDTEVETEEEASDSDSGNASDDKPYCGDLVVSFGEQCDFFGIKHCNEFGYHDGYLSCVDCQFDFSDCVIEEETPEEEQDTDTGNVDDTEPYCGDLVVDRDEQCDFFGIKSCTEFGYYEGYLSCSGCQFDFSSCVIEPEDDTPLEVMPICERLHAETDCPSIKTCNAALALTGLQIEETTNEESALRSHLRSWMCDTANSASVYEYAKAHETSGGFSFLGFSLGGGHSYEEDLYMVETWQREHCEEYVESISTSEVRNHLVTVVDNRPTLEAWVECVSAIAAAQVSCIANQENPTGLILVPRNFPGKNGLWSLLVRWCGTGGVVSEIDAEVTNPLSITGAECEFTDELTTGEMMRIGTMEFPCRRIENEEILVTLAVKTKVAGRRFSATTFLEESCVPGDKECYNGIPRACDASERWQELAPCLGECVMETDECSDQCVPDERKCEGNAVVSCEADADWGEPEPCQYLCSDGYCTGECTPGSRRCSSDTVQVCNAEANWTNETSCSYGCTGGSSPVCRQLKYKTLYTNSGYTGILFAILKESDPESGQAPFNTVNITLLRSGSNLIARVYYKTEEQKSNWSWGDVSHDYIIGSIPSGFTFVDFGVQTTYSYNFYGSKDVYWTANPGGAVQQIKVLSDTGGDDLTGPGFGGIVGKDASIEVWYASAPYRVSYIE